MITWGRNIKINGSWLASPVGSHARVPPSQTSLSPKERVKAYEQKVHAVLERIYKRSRAFTGRFLLEAIDRLQATRRIMIVPVEYGDTDQQCRSYSPLDTCYQSVESPTDSKDCTGVGSNVHIWYEPVFWDRGDHHESLDDHRDRRSDDVLVHELFHGLQAMTGSILMGSNANLAVNGWENHREFQAILIENIYRSETKRNQGLRGDHAIAHHRLSSMPDGAALVASDKLFYRKYHEEIDAMCDMPNGQFFISLMTTFGFIAPNAWNPLRAKRIVEREEAAERAAERLRVSRPGSLIYD